MSKFPVAKLPAFIPLKFGNSVIEQRNKDGYINATAMCKAAGKKFNDYTRLDATQEFLHELEADAGIPVTVLIQTVRGGEPHRQGSWVHPRVAINLAERLSGKFANWVTKLVFDWLTAAPDRQKWLDEREEGKPHRKTFVEIIAPRVKEWRPNDGVRTCTNAIIVGVTGYGSNKFRELNNLKPKAICRDAYSITQLVITKLTEQTVVEATIARDIYDKPKTKGQIYKLCKEISREMREVYEATESTRTKWLSAQ